MILTGKFVHKELPFVYFSNALVRPIIALLTVRKQLPTCQKIAGNPSFSRRAPHTGHKGYRIPYPLFLVGVTHYTHPLESNCCLMALLVKYKKIAV